MTKKPFTPDEFQAIYSRVPRISVDLVIESQGRTLLLKRALKSYRGQWHLPGGTVYYQETVTDAVKRIGKEELGYSVTVDKFLTFIEYHSELYERGFGYTIGLAFKCSIAGGKLLLDEGASEVAWFDHVPDNTVVDQIPLLKSIIE